MGLLLHVYCMKMYNIKPQDVFTTGSSVSCHRDSCVFGSVMPSHCTNNSGIPCHKEPSCSACFLMSWLTYCMLWGVFMTPDLLYTDNFILYTTSSNIISLEGCIHHTLVSLITCANSNMMTIIMGWKQNFSYSAFPLSLYDSTCSMQRGGQDWILYLREMMDRNLARNNTSKMPCKDMETQNLLKRFVGPTWGPTW
jgi:hypothetical protein